MTTTELETTIEQLRAAAKKVADATHETFVYASIEVRHEGACRFKIYRRKYHEAETLDDAVNLAISYDDVKEKEDAIARLQADIDAIKSTISK